MRTPLLVGIVVGIHCVAVGSAVLIQGCRTNQPPKVEPAVVTKTTDIKAPEVVPPAVETVQSEQKLPEDVTTYVVGKGDTLSEIAYKYELKVPEIMALNCMTSANKLRVGQKLKLPGKINVDSPKRHIVKKPKVQEANPEAIAAGAVEYTIQSGDSLSSIAVKHGTTVAAIKKINGLTSNALKAGQKLMVPGAAKEEKPAATQEATPAPAEASPAPAPATEPVAPPADNMAAPAAAPAGTPAPSAEPVLAPAPAVQPSAVAPVSGPAKAATQTYTVEPNDDIVKVSKMWGVSVDELKKLNGLTDAALKPGQVLKIPIVE